MTVTRLTAAIAVVLGLAGPAAATNTTTYWAPADYQRAELLACKRDLGIAGDVRLVTRRAWNGGVRVRVEPYGGIDLQEAEEINRCAERRAVAARADVYRLWPSARTCYRDAPILFRGNLYCFPGR